MTLRSGTRVGQPVVVRRGANLAHGDMEIPAGPPVDDSTRAAARLVAADWALTQDDPRTALAELLDMLGLLPTRTTRAPGRCACGDALPDLPGSRNHSPQRRQGMCAACTPPPPPPPPRPAPLAPCGTTAGFKRHRRNGESCRECTDANNAARRAARGAQGARTRPSTLYDPFAEEEL